MRSASISVMMQMLLYAGASYRKKVVSATCADGNKDEIVKKEELEERDVENPRTEVDECATGDGVFKTEETTADDNQLFKQDYYNDDDDFEWKEEPLVEIHDDSVDSEGKYEEN